MAQIRLIVQAKLFELWKQCSLIDTFELFHQANTRCIVNNKSARLAKKNGNICSCVFVVDYGHIDGKSICWVPTKNYPTSCWSLLAEPVFLDNTHCVKNVQIWSFLWSVFSRIRTEHGGFPYFRPNTAKYGPEKNSLLGHFSRSDIF